MPIARGHRGWKEHPLGRLEREGGLPGTVSRTDLSPNAGSELIKYRV
jgi:hypothetical protein